MKYAIIADNGRKSITLASNDYIDIYIKDGNKYIARLTLRQGSERVGVFDENDNDISSATGNDNHY